ncbi:MAG: DUF397 domain-containing protein [Pseudonocardiaceae bacterium]
MIRSPGPAQPATVPSSSTPASTPHPRWSAHVKAGPRTRSPRTSPPLPPRSPVVSSPTSPGSRCRGPAPSRSANFLTGPWAAVRHSRHPHDPVIVYTRAEWEAFTAGVRLGEFDFSDS